MSQSHLNALYLERFKSFATATKLQLAPLTILLGRNNSGKSSLIQSLLLLKQTLAEPRPEVPLHLEGFVSAFNLRELTTGWPGAGPDVEGPAIGIEWSCEIDPGKALSEARNPDLPHLAKHTGLAWIEDGTLSAPKVALSSTIRLSTREVSGTTQISEILLSSSRGGEEPVLRLTQTRGKWLCYWRGSLAAGLEVELDHFVPYLRIDRSKLGPRDKQRAWHNAYLILFAQPLEGLKRLLAGFQYLGSSRTLPPSLYKASNVAPQEIGVSGELAAQLLHRRQRDVVHYALPLDVASPVSELPEVVRERPLVDAVNDVLGALSIQAPLTVEEVQEVGFRLLFGSASLLHVGRGLTYLLPLVELGLFADPMRFVAVGRDLTRSEYTEACHEVAHVALEEPEAHLHPKVQSRLAHWLVSLALTSRRMIVETHSDHLVRRLRGLVARAGSGTEMERWLLENVIIWEVEQDSQGCSTVKSTRLTAEGSLEDRWPADFMDEASEEDSAIYYAALAKGENGQDRIPTTLIVHDEGDEPELAP